MGVCVTDFARCREGLLWDDLYEHEVVNTGTAPRVILMVDFLRTDTPPRARFLCNLLQMVVHQTEQFKGSIVRMTVRAKRG